MKCPACAVEMDEHARHGVKIDHCARCGGVWLDKGELDHLIAAVRPAIILPDPEPDPPARARPERDGAESRPPRKPSGKAPTPGRWDLHDPSSGQGQGPGRARRYTGRHTARSRLKSVLEEIFDFD